MSHKFTVTDKEINTRYLEQRCKEMRPFLDQESYTHKNINKRIEGWTMYSSPVQTAGGSSPLFHAISWAFNGHLPLILTPDAVWLTCLVGLTHHIDTDPEGLRHHFVQHEGKVQITVKEYSPPLPHVPPEVWESGIGQFSEKIKEHIGKKHDLIVCDFSTTQRRDRLSSQIALMGAMKHYFQYRMMLACGLTDVTIAGTPDDWALIRQRVRAMGEFDLAWWTDHLEPVIEQFQLACEGRPEIDFWQRVYVGKGFGSGSQEDVSGWVNVFHPYIAGKNKGQMRRNPFVDWQEGGSGNDKDDFPFGLVSAPVLLDDHGAEYDFEFYGGLVGVAATKEGVQPVSGWTIQNLGAHKGG